MEKPAEKPADKPAPAEKPAEKVFEKVAEKATEKPAEKKQVDTTPEKQPDKPKPAETKPAADKAQAEAQRAAAILAGKHVDTPEPATGSGGQFVILIGAFANPANVKQLQSKLSELGIKVYTEPLDGPDGKKTRVRAGPFPNHDAAEKAAEKMKRIGVNGVIAAKP